MISAGHISGGHLNPAVTLGLLAGGHITVFRSILYWIDQLVASSAACLLLSYLTGGMVIVHVISWWVSLYSAGHSCDYAGKWGRLRSRGSVGDLLTFSLLFTVYGTIVDPKKGSIDGLGPLLTGLVVGANILAGGSFSGAAMNPARSFGPALVSWDWTHHWVYWVGPLIGGGLAGFIYENFFITRSHLPLPNDEETYLSTN
ncbi:hypothetical protein GH714_036506 [Hevea brasiliensis]|uniref:Tonoplast intrinsic protein n=1 Tax=Hevea brasiliensis TaxID=3981 RepID=A0A6A6KEV2_HEVBR|nr:hypothetical protein GH714_036506 [Hevea brasiliensis]